MADLDKTDKTYYVRVKNAWHLRKAMLEASKEVIVILQRYEMFKRLRETKLKLMEDLSKEFKEMLDTSSKMGINMPVIEFKNGEDQETDETKNAQGKEGDSSTSEKPVFQEADIDEEEIKKLESAISEIERKLSNM